MRAHNQKTFDEVGDYYPFPRPENGGWTDEEIDEYHAEKQRELDEFNEWYAEHATEIAAHEAELRKALGRGG